MLLTKCDLLPHLPGYRVEAVEAALAETMPAPRLVRCSAVTGEGLATWIAWLAARRAELPPATGGRHHHHPDHHHHG